MTAIEVRLADVRRGDVLLTERGRRTALNDARENRRAPKIDGAHRVGLTVRNEDGGASSLSGHPDLVVDVERLEPPLALARDGAPDEDGDWLPVGVHEIAERLGVVRGTVDGWRVRGLDFPEARWMVGNRPAWLWQDVEAWATVTGRL
jgi:predicted DNA-binding transcriptional regulator AlpA